MSVDPVVFSVTLSLKTGECSNKMGYVFMQFSLRILLTCDSHESWQ